MKKHREQILEHYPASKAIANDDLLEILASAQTVSFKAEQVLFEELQDCRAFPFVLEGNIRVIQRSENGREISLYNVTPGDVCVVSAACLLGNQPYNALGIVQSDCLLVMVPVQSVGTGASLRGVATVLKRYNPKIKIIAVEPGESAVLSGGQPGAHDIEGIGIGYTPPLWELNLVDEVVSVKTADAKGMARHLARKEGIFAGTSSGGNVDAAIRVARKLGPSAKVVTLIIDSGLKYLSTNLYRVGPAHPRHRH